ncbi:hypothetical protein E2C01_030998 [Portunus trituberculatus]|uniref:Uncharacterized protein n=1 Tax=Portunus trituberculatus TaxID=210409 RepID=A0A5B7EWF3_PORTR|nr:hypothetical protein [Portunus trituberculatus]
MVTDCGVSGEGSDAATVAELLLINQDGRVKPSETQELITLIHLPLSCIVDVNNTLGQASLLAWYVHVPRLRHSHLTTTTTTTTNNNNNVHTQISSHTFTIYATLHKFQAF